MARSGLEVAHIFCDHGPAWREANRGHISLEQLKVMSAIERCRTDALGGHVARCENEGCAYTLISYDSCCDRHCPKCQAAASRDWLAERDAELLPVAKEPFAGSEPVLRYLARYTHRVAISNRRLVAADEGGIAFRWKDYRLDAPNRLLAGDDLGGLRLRWGEYVPEFLRGRWLGVQRKHPLGSRRGHALGEAAVRLERRQHYADGCRAPRGYQPKPDRLVQHDQDLPPSCPR
jgi:hypothetical protein